MTTKHQTLMRRLLFIILLVTLQTELTAQNIPAQTFYQPYIAAMDSIINRDPHRPSAKVLFAALYKNIMQRIEEKLNGEHFTDACLVENAEQHFAGLFLRKTQSPDSPPPGSCWRQVQEEQYCSQQHPMPGLLLAINAHVNEDLLSCLLQVYPNGKLPANCKKDYDFIFGVLQKEIAAVATRYQQATTGRSIGKPLFFYMGKCYARHSLRQYRRKIFGKLRQVAAGRISAEEALQRQQQQALALAQNISLQCGPEGRRLQRIMKKYPISYEALLYKVLLHPAPPR